MREDLPGGTVTFLFTDVEGSTGLLHELGAERYADALAAHRRVIRTAVHEHGGVEVDTQGDAFFVAFPTAPGALAAAAQSVAKLGRGPIRVRIGLHSGTPLLTDEGYVGIDVHRAARIAACGHGGQVVVSAATANLVGRDGLTDLGEHRFKDLSAPEHVYQLGSDRFPPLRTLYRTNLPVPATPFLGRSRELGELVGLLGGRDLRLVTLVGPGGTGKTRLALQAAGAVADAFPGGVFWVPLATVRDPQLLLPLAAQAVGAKGELAQHVGTTSMLLLLDNFEQLVAAADDLPSLLASCPNLRLLVTSRELLRLPGEQAYHVPPLSSTEGLGFFVARAQSFDPAFLPTPATETLCAQLDQLPLALELAAARVRVLSPAALLERLSQRLDILKAGRGVDPRQQTLRATIEWSHDLLSPDERRLFAELAIFSGGCTLGTAEEVLGADLDVLQSLVDKSLVRARADGRFWMLETIGEYAAERLAEMDGVDALRRRHAGHYVDLAERVEPELSGDSQTDPLELLEDDYPNIRAALAWLTEVGDHERALRLAGALVRFWYEKGYLFEGRRWLEGALVAPRGARSAARAKALGGAALLSTMQADWPAARLWATEARSLGLELGESRDACVGMLTLGRAALAEGRPEEGIALFEEASALGAATGNRAAVSMAAFNLGYAALEHGDPERARTAFERVVEQTHDRNVLARGLAALGSVALHQDRAADAAPLLQRSLGISRELGDRDDTVAWALELLGVALGRLEPARSARLMAQAASRRDELGGSLTGIELRLHDDALEALRAALGPDDLARAWASGRTAALADVLDEIDGCTSP